MGGVMQWVRINVLSKFRSWGKMFALGVQWALEKGAQGVDSVANPALFVGFWFFAWLAYNTYSGMEALPKDEAARTLEWLKFYAYVVGGIVLIWQVRIANRRATALERTAALGEKGNITERFKNAIEHLANTSEPIRIGGIYGLYHVAREASEYADTVLKILCAHAKSIMAEPGYTERETPSNEIAAILDVLFPVISYDANQNAKILFERVDISDWHLHGANLILRDMRNIIGGKVILSKAKLSEANLSDVYLVGADLRRADLLDASLSAARLSGAKLSGANLSGANLSEAGLGDANLSDADLWNTDLSDADLMDANLSRAKLINTRLTNANLWNADLSMAEINVEKLLQAQTLYRAKFNDHIREQILHYKPELLDPPFDFPDEEK